MNTILKKIQNIHPLVKLIFYLNFTVLFFYGNIYIGLLSSIICYLVLVFYKGNKSILASPNYTLAFCIFTLLLSLLIFSNSNEEIIQTGIFTIRLFAIMIFSIFSVLLFLPHDFIYLLRLFGINKKHFPIYFSVLRFMPITIKDFTDIIFSQRARGLSFNIKSLFRRETYLSLTVPYITSILKNVVVTNISLEIKTFKIPEKKYALNILDFTLIASCIFFWFV